MKKFLIIIILIVLTFPLSASATFPQLEDSLRRMSSRIIELEHDFERLALNNEFNNLLGEVLKMPGSLNHPFNTFRIVSVLTAPDGSFRIFSWYIPLSNSQFEYFGYFQFRQAGKEPVLYPLTDKGYQIEEPQFASLDHENWYGAYYTELIHRKEKRKDYYVLLGWRGDNPLTRKRIIEPLKLMERGRPAFGEPVFRFENNRHKRIIFEYSSRVSMSIRYEEHLVPGTRRAQDIIIFDRMGPTQNYLQGNYQFYVPETNIFDGFRFEDGKWIFVSDIDAKNQRRNPVPRPIPPTN
jgi:hypothetical protein